MKTTWIKWLAAIGAAAICAMVLFPVFVRDHRPRRSMCQSNLKNIGLGIQQYLQDYDEKFPIAGQNGDTFGWIIAANPYIKSRQIFHCDKSSNQIQDDPRQRSYTDYWMNGQLSGINQNRITSSATTLLNGEGNYDDDASDARYNLKAVPQAWISDSQSPLYRHLDGAFYGFADGHVKWYHAERHAQLKFALK